MGAGSEEEEGLFCVSAAIVLSDSSPSVGVFSKLPLP